MTYIFFTSKTNSGGLKLAQMDTLSLRRQETGFMKLESNLWAHSTLGSDEAFWYSLIVSTCSTLAQCTYKECMMCDETFVHRMDIETHIKILHIENIWYSLTAVCLIVSYSLHWRSNIKCIESKLGGSKGRWISVCCWVIVLKLNIKVNFIFT